MIGYKLPDMSWFKMETEDEGLLTKADIAEIDEIMKNAKEGDFKTQEQMKAECDKLPY